MAKRPAARITTASADPSATRQTRDTAPPSPAAHGARLAHSRSVARSPSARSPRAPRPATSANSRPRGASCGRSAQHRHRHRTRPLSSLYHTLAELEGFAWLLVRGGGPVRALNPPRRRGGGRKTPDAQLETDQGTHLYECKSLWAHLEGRTNHLKINHLGVYSSSSPGSLCRGPRGTGQLGTSARR